MIKTKIIKRARQRGAIGGATASVPGMGFAGTGTASTGGSTDSSKHADEADHAKEADHADSARTLDNDSPVYDKVLRKDRTDRTPYDLAVGGNLTAEEEIGSKEFAEGITGFGWRGDKDGHFEMDSLTLRRFLEVPELRHNRTEVYTGIEWHAPGGGIVEQATLMMQDDESWRGYVFLKLEDGEIGAVAPGDICMGIWHFEKGSYVNHNISNPDPNEDINDTMDSDNGMGDFTFAGFRTIYFEIQRVFDDEYEEEYTDPDTGEVKTITKIRPNGRIMVRTRNGYPLPPMAGMHFVCYGNRTNKDRQTSRYATRTYERYLANVTDYELGKDTLMAQFGDLSNLSVYGMQMTGYSAYLNNVYFTGTLHQVRIDDMMLIEWDIAPQIIHCDAEGKPVDSEISVKVFQVQGSERSLINSEWTTVEDFEVVYNISYTRSGSHAETEYALLTDDKIALSRTYQYPSINLQVYRKSDKSLISSRLLKYVTDGAEGKQGESGVQGGVIRMVGSFQSGVTYYAGDTPDASGVRWVDVAWVDSASASGLNRDYWVCRRTGVYNTSPSSGASTFDGWEKMNSLGAIFADMVIASNGKIKFLSSNEIVFGEYPYIFGRIGAPVGDDGTILFLGGNMPNTPAGNNGGKVENATVVLNKNGFARFGQAKGERVEIDPNAREVRVYDSGNKEVVLIDGKEHPIEEVYDCQNSLPDRFEGKLTNGSGSLKIGTVKTAEGGGELYVYLDVDAHAESLRSDGGGTSMVQIAKGSVQYNIRISREGTGALWHQLGTQTLEGPDLAIIGSQNKGERDSSHSWRVGGVLPEGTFDVWLDYTITHGSITGGTTDDSITYGSFQSKFKAGNSPKCIVSKNGLLVANSTQDYLKAGMVNGAWTVEMSQGGVGLRIKDGKFQATDSTGRYRDIDFSPLMAQTATLETRQPLAIDTAVSNKSDNDQN